MKKQHLAFIIILTTLFVSCKPKSELIAVSYDKNDTKESVLHYLKKNEISITDFEFNSDSVVYKSDGLFKTIKLPDCFIFNNIGDRVMNSNKALGCINNEWFTKLNLQGIKYNNLNRNSFLRIIKRINGENPNNFKFTNADYYIFISYDLKKNGLKAKTNVNLENWLRKIAKKKCNIKLFVIKTYAFH